MPGSASGIHLMPVMWEAVVPRVVTEGRLLPPDFLAPAGHAQLIAADGLGTRA